MTPLQTFGLWAFILFIVFMAVGSFFAVRDKRDWEDYDYLVAFARKCEINERNLSMCLAELARLQDNDRLPEAILAELRIEINRRFGRL